MSFPLTAPEMARNPAHGLKPPDSESFLRRHVERQLQRRSTAPGCRPKLVSDPDQALPCGCHQALLFSGRSLRKPPGVSRGCCPKAVKVDENGYGWALDGGAGLLARWCGCLRSQSSR